MQGALSARQENVNQINNTYKTLSDECRQHNVEVPHNMQHKMKILNSDWARILYLSSKMQTNGDDTDTNTQTLIEGK